MQRYFQLSLFSRDKQQPKPKLCLRSQARGGGGERVLIFSGNGTDCAHYATILQKRITKSLALEKLLCQQNNDINRYLNIFLGCES